MKTIISICIALFFTFVCACERVEENYLSENVEYTADALDAMLTNLEEQGYKIVPISKLIMKKNYHMDATGKQIADDAEKQKTTEAVIH